MFHFKNVKDGANFEFCGIQWYLREIHLPDSFCDEHMIKIHVHDDCDAIEPIKVKITGRIFIWITHHQKKHQKRTSIHRNPNNGYMINNYSPNPLSFDYYGTPIRISLLMQRME